MALPSEEPSFKGPVSAFCMSEKTTTSSNAPAMAQGTVFETIDGVAGGFGGVCVARRSMPQPAQNFPVAGASQLGHELGEGT